MAHRENYSGFKYFQALTPGDYDGSAAVNGADVDTEGYNAITFVVNVGTFTGGGSMLTSEEITFALQHAEASTAGGAGTYTDVPSQYILMSGTNTVTSGQFLSLTSASFSGAAYPVGYIGPNRYVRLKTSGVQTSLASVAGLVILGYPENWPVNKVGA
jgi:hypothetical protein